MAVLCFLGVLLFKNGFSRKVILAECVNFASVSCSPPVLDLRDITRRVDAVFRYRSHISDAKFAEWFHLTPTEMVQLPYWFKQTAEIREPMNLRIARRRTLVDRERRRLDLFRGWREWDRPRPPLVSRWRFLSDRALGRRARHVSALQFVL